MSTNVEAVKAPRKQLSATHKFVLFMAIWAVLFLLLALVGGCFASGPSEIPAGMSWVNADASGPTFYILRGGPRQILELDRHSQLVFLGLMTFGFLAAGNTLWLALQGKLRYRKRGKTERMPRSGQYAGVVFFGLVTAFIAWEIGGVLRGQTLDLDPVHDAVVLDGETVAHFRDLQGFDAYTTRGLRSSYAHLRMYLRQGRSIRLGGPMPRWDVLTLAPDLNHYLQDVRGARTGHW